MIDLLQFELLILFFYLLNPFHISTCRELAYLQLINKSYCFLSSSILLKVHRTGYIHTNIYMTDV